MSYIRYLSNPEGLYVYHCVGGNIIWSTGDEQIYIPANIFYTFVKKMPSWKSEYKRGSLEIKEIFYPSRKRLTKEQKAIKKTFPDLDLYRGEYKITLFYKGQEVARMWGVTWKYIYNNVMGDIKRRKKFKV